MRSLPRAIALLAAAATLGAVAVDASAATVPVEPPGTLYVMQAGGGTLQRAPGGWRLVLRDPDATITTFTDRPARIGGAQALGRFASSWSRTFGDDPPNAALQLDRAPARHDVVLLELGRPRYDRTAGTLTFRVRPLRTTRQRQLSTIAGRADTSVASRFGRASLFIDDGPTYGFDVNVNLLGGVPNGQPVTFSITLQNSQFQEFAQFQQSLSFGHSVTPSYTVDFSTGSLAMTIPSGDQLIGTIDPDLPSSGSSVQATVVVPFGYTLQLQSGSSVVTTSQSGPVSIPAPPPPS
jgi:hypothetical protein